MTEVTRLRTIAVAAYGPTALSSVGLGAVTPVLALTALRVGADAGGAAVVVALLGVGMVAGDLPAGAFAARFGERWALIGASLLEAAAFAAAGLTSSVPALAAAVFAAGLAQSAFGLARHSYLAEAVPASLRARALSTLGGVHRVGMLLGPFIGAAAVARWGLGGAYAVAAVAGVGAALLVLSIRDLESPSRQTGGLPAADAPIEQKLTVTRVLTAHRRVLATLGLGVLAIAAVRAARNAVVPIWAEAIGLDGASTSLVFGISGTLDMLLFYPAGWLMDRYGRAAVAVPSMLVLGIGLLLMPLAGSFWSLVAVASVLGIGNGIGSGVLLTLGADVSPAQGRAQFLSGWRLMADLGWVAGPGLVGAVAAIASLGIASGVLGLIAWVGAAWLWVWAPRMPDRLSEADRNPPGAPR
ncbi:MAG: MFS transporter [Actinomycetales bacterium]|nr:MAG: MFS transporter [Actinomycetales bacterium]